MPEKKEIRIQIHGQPEQSKDAPEREMEFWLDIMEKRIIEAFSQSSDEDVVFRMLREQLRYLEC